MADAESRDFWTQMAAERPLRQAREAFRTAHKVTVINHERMCPDAFADRPRCRCERRVMYRQRDGSFGFRRGV